MLFSGTVFSPLLANADASADSILSEYDYLCANVDDTLGFVYNDGFFFTDNNQLSPELAKMSAALSSAAYNYGWLAQLLAGISCSSIVMMNFDKAHTEEDYDFVRYAIAARRGVSFQGRDYILYFLPIQGTRGSYDWCGNFKLGDGPDHEGFSIAAEKVLLELAAEMAGDGYSRDTRIILTTGHSRGAAVSNIVAAALSGGSSAYVLPEHVFSYNFACPSVSKNADESLLNIYNFNSADDIIPLVPMAEWGYRRNGVTMELSRSALRNVQQRFLSYVGTDYAGTPDVPQAYAEILNRLIPDNESASTVTAAVLKGLAAYMKAKNISMNDFFEAMGIHLSQASSNSDVYMSPLDETGDWEMTMSEEVTFDAALESVDTSYLMNLLTEGMKLYQLLSNAANTDAIVHGHLPDSYLLWINSLYYGFSGWRDNANVRTCTIAASVLTVAPYCFSGVSELNNLEIGDNVSFIGDSAFRDCAMLKKLVLPVNLAMIGDDAFGSLQKPVYVYFAGGSEEWERVLIGSGNEALLAAKIHLDPAALTPDLALPSALAEIESETFAGGAFTYVSLDQAGTIGPRAFADCDRLVYVYISDGTKIDESAFENVEELTILGGSDLKLMAYAQQHGFDFISFSR